MHIFIYRLPFIFWDKDINGNVYIKRLNDWLIGWLADGKWLQINDHVDDRLLQNEMIRKQLIGDR